MWILSVNRSHDASVCLFKDGELVFHCVEERLTHTKNAIEVVHSLETISTYTKTIDYLICTNLNEKFRDPHAFYVEILLKKYGVQVGEIVSSQELHHHYHAICGFMSSPFDKAVCVIVDGAGSDLSFTSKENESIIKLELSENKLLNKILHKTVIGNNPKYPSTYGVGMAYNAITKYIGFGDHESGKTMGLAPYGAVNKKYVPLITKDGANKIYFEPYHHNHYGIVSLIYKSTETNDLSFEEKSELSYKIQTDFEKYVYNLCIKALNLSGCKNIVLSGGCFLNCVSNYKLLKKLPEDVNVHVDPLCSDVGISIGQSYASNEVFNYKEKVSFKKFNPAYNGNFLTYNYTLKDYQSERKTSPKEVSKLLSEGNIVAIAQGRAETGPRALGNRSILFDPRVKDGKEIVNRVKRREWWRPFAGTVMLEYAREWFDMNRLKESPFMCYAVDVLSNKKELIPSITHIDGTCRIQTVTSEQNKHYYDLISEFNNITGVPILFNTSFNLAGDTIVDTIEDALRTLEESEIEYLYLPDIMKLIHIPNK